ncbi:OsmC family protein [Azotobacter bryophylli]|uniref:OsmC family protein n=1 Tax=Azotobacter bryophylli TaxID=1986537 RepID=A0ABV7AUM4_9GAMM
MAMKTLSARGQMGAGTSIEVECGSHRLVMDQSKNGGGQDLGPGPLSVLLASLAGCFGSIGRMVARKRQVDLRGMQFALEADYDPDGLLGLDPGVRAGFQELRLQVEIDADLDRPAKQALLEEIEKRCPVADMLEYGTRLVTCLA